VNDQRTGDNIEKTHGGIPQVAEGTLSYHRPRFHVDQINMVDQFNMPLTGGVRFVATC
jgi:hypothetical protein